jgi:predicted MFS family arabinose efflux permease
MNALIPALVEPPDLDQAIALNSTSFTLARAVGPAVGGVLIAAFGAAFAFGVNALTFIPLIVVLAVIRPRPVSLPPGDRSVRAGFAYVRSRPAMPWLILITLTVGWAGDPANTLAPAYADMFGRDESFVGLLVTAFGVGSATASFFVGTIRSRLGPLRTTGVGIALLAAGLLGFAAAPTEVVALASLCFAGVGFLLGVTTTNSNLQSRLDEEMRGRVMALWSMAFLGSRPLAALIDGLVADLVSPRVGVLAAIVPLAFGAWGIARVARLDAAAKRSVSSDSA